MSRSKKTVVIEAIFDERWDSVTKTLSDPLVRVSDIRRHWPEGNVYAFFKDIVRNAARANGIWPQSVLERGFTGAQDVSDGGSFRFVPLRPGQTVAFVDTYAPSDVTPRHRIESASLPLASRRLGRGDEPWLIQVAVRLRIIETHLALFSRRQILTVDHLQMSVKLQPAEVDALFLAVEQLPDLSTRELIICCEAKSLRDDIVEEQVLRQVQAIAAQPAVTQALVLPVALKAIGASTLFVVEFEAVAREEAASTTALQPVSDAVYELVPPVPGIGDVPRRHR
jgi:hypothetical protein